MTSSLRGCDFGGRMTDTSLKLVAVTLGRTPIVIASLPLIRMSTAENHCCVSPSIPLGITPPKMATPDTVLI